MKVTSYTTSVKEEIVWKDNNWTIEQQRILVAPFVYQTGLFDLQNQRIMVSVKNRKVAKFIYQIYKHVFNLKVNFFLKNYGKKITNKLYLIIEPIQPDDLTNFNNLLKYQKFENIVKSINNQNQLIIALITGFFLISGSISNPRSKNHHFEIWLKDEIVALQIKKWLFNLKIPANIITRNNKYFVYIKKAFYIVDILKYFKAIDNMYDYEDIRSENEFALSKKREVNIEFYNVQKIVNTSQQYIKKIDKLKETGKFRYLDKTLQNIADLRFSNPHASLQELTIMYNKKYSINHDYKKSTIFSWLKKIMEF